VSVNIVLYREKEKKRRGGMLNIRFSRPLTRKSAFFKGVFRQKIQKPH
jgi:hypothetical protein